MRLQVKSERSNLPWSTVVATVRHGQEESRWQTQAEAPASERHDQVQGQRRGAESLGGRCSEGTAGAFGLDEIGSAQAGGGASAGELIHAETAFAPEVVEPRLDVFGLPLALRPGLSRLWVGVQLVRRADVKHLPQLRSAADVFKEFASMGSLDREAFLVLLLNQKNRITGVHVVSIGSLAASLVHPRETFRAAVIGGAAAVVVLHNHPSGDPTPSREDREITARLKLVGETLGVPLVDHVVIGDGSYRSFAESGLL